jgi:hypothetical protein
MSLFAIQYINTQTLTILLSISTSNDSTQRIHQNYRRIRLPGEQLSLQKNGDNRIFIRIGLSDETTFPAQEQE